MDSESLAIWLTSPDGSVEASTVGTNPPSRAGILSRLVWQVLGCMSVLIAYALLIRLFGTFTAKRTAAAPLHAWWRHRPTWQHPLGLLLMTVPVALFLSWRRILTRRDRRQPGGMAFVALAVLWVMAMHLSVCLLDADHGGDVSMLRRVTQRFDFARVQFYDDLPLVHSTRQFLHDYVQLHRDYQLAVHSNTHPPGSVLFLHCVRTCFGPGLATAAFAATGFAALGVIPAYLIARRLYGRRVAVLAVGLLAVTPNFVLYGYTSMDGVYLPFMLTSIWLYLEATSTASRRNATMLSVVLGLCMAVCAMLTFATCCLGVLMGLHALLAGFKSGRFRRRFAVLTAAAFIFIGLYVLLDLWCGYSLLACAKASVGSDESYMGPRNSTLHQYLDYSLADLAAFLIGIGFPASLLLAQHTRTAARRAGSLRIVDPFLLATAATLLFMAFSTLFRLETERIWIFMTPLAILPLARWAARHSARGTPADGPSTFDLALGMQFGQMLLMQCLLWTHW